MKQRKKRRSVTLVEMIIVMILIATITGALAYNYKGSLNKGKAFKTEQTIKKIETILTIHLTEHPEDRDKLSDESALRQIIRRSPIAPNLKSGEDPLIDGWGNRLQISAENDEDGELSITVTSAALTRYNQGK